MQIIGTGRSQLLFKVNCSDLITGTRSLYWSDIYVKTVYFGMIFLIKKTSYVFKKDPKRNYKLTDNHVLEILMYVIYLYF
jgi:hypothetical protein